ncbi:MAG TPA: hypothetical protein VGZ73_28780 [Bryobacteraceae bacterium]|jgi:hypothetical protein|nr:hypothetical protein [Bryobacteraceae bacterium]
MRYRLLAAVFAACLVAMGQSLSVEKLVAFLQSSEKLIKEGKMTDRDLANYLTKVKLTERLDDRTIEEIQGYGKIGPKTLQALTSLRDRTQALAAAAPIVAPPKPTPIPPPSSEEQAAILDEVRQYALNYSKNLPDFICTQVTRRYAAPAPGTKHGGSIDSQPSWQSLDTLQIRLSYFEQKEDYKLIMVNSSPTTQDYKTVGGATSTGDFGSMMREIFEPATEARFEWDHWGTLRGRRVMAFSYRVAQQRSQWHVTYDKRLDIVPAYSGLVEVDKTSHEVMRVTLKADDIPASFPVKQADTVLDYDYQDISGHTFLLPLKAQVIMAADNYMTRNDEEFRIYRKYSTSADITFETEEKTPPPPLPEDKTKETKDPKVTKK